MDVKNTTETADIGPGFSAGGAMKAKSLIASDLLSKVGQGVMTVHKEASEDMSKNTIDPVYEERAEFAWINWRKN